MKSGLSIKMNWKCDHIPGATDMIESITNYNNQKYKPFSKVSYKDCSLKDRLSRLQNFDKTCICQVDDVFHAIRGLSEFTFLYLNHSILNTISYYITNNIPSSQVHKYKDTFLKIRFCPHTVVLKINAAYKEGVKFKRMIDQIENYKEIEGLIEFLKFIKDDFVNIGQREIPSCDNNENITICYYNNKFRIYFERKIKYFIELLGSRQVSPQTQYHIYVSSFSCAYEKQMNYLINYRHIFFKPSFKFNEILKDFVESIEFHKCHFTKEKLKKASESELLQIASYNIRYVNEDIATTVPREQDVCFCRNARLVKLIPIPFHKPFDWKQRIMCVGSNFITSQNLPKQNILCNLKDWYIPEERGHFYVNFCLHRNVLYIKYTNFNVQSNFFALVQQLRDTHEPAAFYEILKFLNHQLNVDSNQVSKFFKNQLSIINNQRFSCGHVFIYWINGDFKCTVINEDWSKPGYMLIRAKPYFDTCVYPFENINLFWKQRLDNKITF